jgi:hypothetical protein
MAPASRSGTRSIAIPHRAHQIRGALGLRRHGRRQGLEQGRVDSFARPGHSREPRDRLAAPGDVDRIPGFDPIEEFAQMGFGLCQIDRVHVTLLTI